MTRTPTRLRPDYDHNLETDLPAPIKAMITRYGNAAQEYAFHGSQPPENHAAIIDDFKIARYNLERTILTMLAASKS